MTRTFVRPRITRPRVVVYREPVVIYTSSDRRLLRNEITSLRNQIRYEAQNDAYVGLEVQDGLREAEMALDDATQMLNYGYARADIRAALNDAEAWIDYARQERAYALESIRTYQEHAQAQLNQAQQYISNQPSTQQPGYFNDASASVQAAQAAYEEADLLARAQQNSDETLAAYKAAAERADSSMRALYASLDEADGSFDYLSAEHDTLEEWMNQVLEHAQEANHSQAIQTLRTAKVALDRAKRSIEKKDADTTRKALDEAADIIDDATAKLHSNS